MFTKSKQSKILLALIIYDLFLTVWRFFKFNFENFCTRRISNIAFEIIRSLVFCGLIYFCFRKALKNEQKPIKIYVICLITLQAIGLCFGGVVTTRYYLIEQPENDEKRKYCLYKEVLILKSIMMLCAFLFWCLAYKLKKRDMKKQNLYDKKSK